MQQLANQQRWTHRQKLILVVAVEQQRDRLDNNLLLEHF